VDNIFLGIRRHGLGVFGTAIFRTSSVEVLKSGIGGLIGRKETETHGKCSNYGDKSQQRRQEAAVGGDQPDW
jgi:hypothetical protein